MYIIMLLYGTQVIFPCVHAFEQPYYNMLPAYGAVSLLNNAQVMRALC